MAVIMHAHASARCTSARHRGFVTPEDLVFCLFAWRGLTWRRSLAEGEVASGFLESDDLLQPIKIQPAGRKPGWRALGLCKVGDARDGECMPTLHACNWEGR